jgi:hypothetical protein
LAYSFAAFLAHNVIRFRRNVVRSAGILPAFDEPKEVAGWKPALRQGSKDFFISLGMELRSPSEGILKLLEGERYAKKMES